jgi:rhodanese-related sulfurtransferase
MNRTAAWKPDWPASFREAGLLLLVSVVAAGGWWARQPDPLPLAADPAVYRLELAAPLVDVAQALAHYDEGLHLFVDTRVETGGETIPGALFIREATFDDDLLANFDFLFPEDQLVLFGDGDLTRTSNVAGRLIDRGYANVEILQGGLGAWKKAGGNTAPVTPEGTP